MKRLIILFIILMPFVMLAQYQPEMDVTGQDDAADGAELQLATPSVGHFLRLFSGRDGDPNPFLYFNQADTFSISSGDASFGNFENLFRVFPSGNLMTKWLTTFYHHDQSFGENYRRLPYLRKGWNGKYWDFMYLGATGGRDNDEQATMMFSNRQGFQFGRGDNEGDTLSRTDVTIDTGGVIIVRNLEGAQDALVLVDSTGRLRRAAHGAGSSGSGHVTDIDGNRYLTVKIGTQTWMRENLRVTHYRNGDPVPEILLNADWVADSLGGWCWYDHDPEKDIPYGKLYNWYAVNDPRGICPTGWHVPSDSEEQFWRTLWEDL